MNSSIKMANEQHCKSKVVDTEMCVIGPLITAFGPIRRKIW
jgi:hypothetical protein